MPIQSAVGYLASNKAADVTTIQTLLNKTLISQSCSASGPTSGEVAASLFEDNPIPPIGRLAEDGSCGPRTVAAIVWFQKNVVGAISPDGVISVDGPTYWSLQGGISKSKMEQLLADRIALPSATTCSALGEKDFEDAAKELGVEVAAIKAVASVEAAGTGFIEDGRPLIRFEAHRFSAKTKHFYDKVFPGISVKNRDDSLVKGGVAGRKREYDRLQKAMLLDRDAALSSTSWGLFQIMGENAEMLKLKSVEELVSAAYKTEQKHLELFIGFIKGKHLATALKNKDWTAFANGYNGTSQVGYDTRMEKAYKKFK